jgi:hypothetical protein
MAARLGPRFGRASGLVREAGVAFERFCPWKSSLRVAALLVLASTLHLGAVRGFGWFSGVLLQGSSAKKRLRMAGRCSVRLQALRV